MAKKTYSVTVEENLLNDFKTVCKEENINQSMLIESFMRSYVGNKIKLELVNNKPEVSVIE